MRHQRIKSPTAFSWHRAAGNFIGTAALIFALLLSGCSGGENETPSPAPPVDNTKLPHSVKIEKSTPNMPSLGTITAEFSDYPEDCNVGMTVDHNDNTKFVTGYDRFFIRWEGQRSVVLSQYSITSADGEPQDDPKSWTLYASANGKTWEELDRQENAVFANRKEKLDYDIKAIAAYKYFRLNVTANNGGDSTRIAEWILMEHVEIIDPLLPYSIEYKNMTYNMPSSGVMTSQYSDFPEKSDLAKIADGYLTSSYITYYSEFYIHWAGAASAAVNSYTLTSAVGDNRANDPKSWTLSGSNDDTQWIVIDTRTNQSFGNNETKEYEVENETPYKYYRLNFTANNGGEFTQIAEWTMEEVPDNIDDLMKYAGSISDSNFKPMGNKFINRHVTVPEDRTWLSDATKEPDFSGTGYTLISFPVTLYPFGEPIPGDVIQHGVGNCGLNSTLASMAYQAPEFIKHILTDNKNGTYTIAMYDPQGSPVTVSVKSTFISKNGSTLISIYGRNGATWASVLEKAIQKWNTIYKVWGADLGGIGSEHITPLFTCDGYSFAFAKNALSNSDMRRLVRVCLNQGWFVVGGFQTAGLPIDGASTVTAHVYTLMHSTNREALFSMRNPWGGNPRDGVLNVPDNNVVPPVIDLRIIRRGKAEGFGEGNTKPYIPPAYN